MINRISSEERKEKARQRAKTWYQANKDRAKAASTGWAKRNAEKISAYKLAWARENKDAIDAARAADHKANPGKRKEQHSRYYKANKTKAYLDSLKWRADNPEKVKVYKKTWVDSNRDSVTRYHHDRRARKADSGGKLSAGIVETLLRLQRGSCAICRRDLQITKHHLDHVVPFALGGANEDGNVQLLCPPCNLSKHSKDPIEFMQSRGFLI